MRALVMLLIVGANSIKRIPLSTFYNDSMHDALQTLSHTSTFVGVCRHWAKSMDSIDHFSTLNVFCCADLGWDLIRSAFECKPLCKKNRFFLSKFIDFVCRFVICVRWQLYFVFNTIFKCQHEIKQSKAGERSKRMNEPMTEWDSAKYLFHTQISVANVLWSICIWFSMITHVSISFPVIHAVLLLFSCRWSRNQWQFVLVVPRETPDNQMSPIIENVNLTKISYYWSIDEKCSWFGMSLAKLESVWFHTSQRYLCAR